MNRKLTVTGSLLWIVGLAAAVIGLNLSGATGTALSLGGNIAFLAGLAILGVVWFRKRRDQEKQQ